jgi:hypothetical protein
MNETTQFPRSAILLGLLWLPVSIGILYLCSIIGWFGIDYFNLSAAIAVSLPLVLGSIQEARALRAGWTQMKAQGSLRTVPNIALFTLGTCTAIVFVCLCAFLIMGGVQN